MKTPNTLISKDDQPWTSRWNTKFGAAKPFAVDVPNPIEWKPYQDPISVPEAAIALPDVSQTEETKTWWETKGKEVLASVDFGAQALVAAQALAVAPPKRKPQPRHRTGYLERVYDPKEFPRTVDETIAMMQDHIGDFDAIAFRGSSGAAIAFIAAHQLQKPLIHIRKDDENSHYGSTLEGYLGAAKIAIVDDFVASGDTIREIVDAVVDTYDKAGYVTPVFTHLFLYAVGCSTQEGAIRGALGECSDEMAIHIAYDRTRF